MAKHDGEVRGNGCITASAIGSQVKLLDAVEMDGRLDIVVNKSVDIGQSNAVIRSISAVTARPGGLMTRAPQTAANDEEPKREENCDCSDQASDSRKHSTQSEPLEYGNKSSKLPVKLTPSSKWKSVKMAVKVSNMHKQKETDRFMEK